MDRLRAVEQWLSWHLDRTRAELGRLERAEERARDEADTAERRRAVLAGWTVQTGGVRWIIHRGECVYRNDKRCRAVSVAEARRLVDSGEAAACTSCGAGGIDAPA
jgi:Family of unknown function (DUF6233)